MTASERHDEVADAAPKAPAKRVTRVGLTPAVEKMFGALVDEQSITGPEARRASPSGAA